MPVLRRLVVVLLLVSASAWAQLPRIYYRGIVNAASFTPPGLPGGAVAQGSTISIFGSNLGPASSPTLAFPLQTTLGGVSITLTQGSTAVKAIPVFVSPGQINAIVPSNTPLGMVSLQVTVNSSRSNPAPLQVATANFGIFAVAAGTGPGILQNFVTQTQQPINSLPGPAQPNQTITLWGTGLGPATFPDNVAPTAGNLATRTEVFVGGVAAKVVYNGRTPCCAGIDQIVFQVPPTAPQGCWVPVYVRTGGAAVSNFVTMAISADGSKCAEPSNVLAQAHINGGNIGSYAAARIAVRHDAGVTTPHDATTDFLAAYQAREAAGATNFNPMFSLPPAGSCTVYTLNGDLTSPDAGTLPGMTPPTGRGLDGGAASLTASAGTKSAQAGPYPGMTALQLAGAIASLPLTNSSFLDPGGLSLKIPGGADIGAASVDSTAPQALTWTNRDQILAINRSSGVNLIWTGAPQGASIFVVAAGVDLPTNSTALALCIAPPGSTSFNIPADVLANIPVTRARAIQSKGVVYLGQWNLATPAAVKASGLDFGSFLPIFVSGKTVSFQ